MRVPHPSTVLAAFGLFDSLRTHPGLHILYAHPTGRGLPHRRSPYSHPNWFPGAVKGLAANKTPCHNSSRVFVNRICVHLTDVFYFHLQTSVLHMCSLFHAFMFAQLWTIYCEQAAAAPSLLNQNQTEFSSSAILTGLEFWSRVTPSILQLMAHNKVVSAPLLSQRSRSKSWVPENVEGTLQVLCYANFLYISEGKHVYFAF